MQYPHLFGPVQSRRLGISLGVDMTPYKTCTLDCIYCECGATTNLTSNRMNYVSVKQLIGELDDYLSHKPELDYITFAGSGEPTLNTSMSEVIEFLKNSFPEYKTALLTNGTLFHIEAVAEVAQQFNLVAPSIDATTESSFKKINRPHSALALPSILESLISFSHKYKGILLIEIFVIPGINDTVEELEQFKTLFQKMKFTRLQLNSLDRPGTDRSLVKASRERLEQIAHFFSQFPVEIISREDAPVQKYRMKGVDAEEMIISILRRRPSTVEDLTIVTAHSQERITEILSGLEKQGVIKRSVSSDRIYYRLHKG